MDSVKQAKVWFVWISIIMILIFLALTVQSVLSLSKRHPAITKQVVAGKLVFHNKNCMDCHTILGDGAYYAADLTKVISIRGEGFVRALLQNPPKVTRALWRGQYKRTMPDMHLTNSQVDDLVVFLKWIGKVNTNGWPPNSANMESTAYGKRDGSSHKNAAAISIIKRMGCGSCHTISVRGLATTGAAGPDLSNEASRGRSVAWLKKQLTAPTSVPDTDVAKGYEGQQSLMPSFKNRLNDDELNILVSFLKNLREGQ